MKDRLILAHHQALLSQSFCDSGTSPSVIAKLTEFYSLPELPSKSLKFTNSSLKSQFFDPHQRQHNISVHHNKFGPLSDSLDNLEDSEEIMEIDGSSTTTLSQTAFPSILKKTVTWSTDSEIAGISAGFISHLKSSQSASTANGEIETDPIDYKSPQDLVVTTVKLQQCI